MFIKWIATTVNEDSPRLMDHLPKHPVEFRFLNQAYKVEMQPVPPVMMRIARIVDALGAGIGVAEVSISDCLLTIRNIPGSWGSGNTAGSAICREILPGWSGFQP
jgi:hypothetical protein